MVAHSPGGESLDTRHLVRLPSVLPPTTRVSRDVVEVAANGTELAAGMRGRDSAEVALHGRIQLGEGHSFINRK